MSETIAYTEIAVPSGLKVFVRPRSYAEWERMEEKRIAALERLSDAEADASFAARRSAFMRESNALRGELLSVIVKDFAAVKDRLSMGDIVFIEDETGRLEGMEIPLGNSASGGAGVLTDEGPRPAGPAQSAAGEEEKA